MKLCLAVGLFAVFLPPGIKYYLLQAVSLLQSLTPYTPALNTTSCNDYAVATIDTCLGSINYFIERKNLFYRKNSDRPCCNLAQPAQAVAHT